MKQIFKLLIKIYQKIISPLKPPCCRFYPTCSKYALDALELHGVVKGSLLSAWRILRCNPFCKGGYDPVPQKQPLKSKNIFVPERYKGRK